MTTNELTIIQKELSPLVAIATGLEIVDDVSLKVGVELLSNLNKYNDNIQETKDKVLKPLLEATKQERLRWKPVENLYEDAITSIRTKLSQYQTNLVKQNKIEQDKIASKVLSGYITPSTGVSKLEKLPEINREVPSESGLVQFAEVKTLKVTDISKITKEYFDLNESRLLKDLKEGKLVEGAEIEIILQPRNYR